MIHKKSKNILLRKKDFYSSVFKKSIPYNTTPTFQKVVWVTQTSYNVKA